jgi:hypothetical protein
MIVLTSLCSDKMAQKNSGVDPPEQRSNTALSVAPNASEPTGRTGKCRKKPFPFATASAHDVKRHQKLPRQGVQTKS